MYNCILEFFGHGLQIHAENLMTICHIRTIGCKNDKVKKLQEAFDDFSGIRENFGPEFKHKTFPNGSVNLNWNIGGHKDHIHVSVQS